MVRYGVTLVLVLTSLLFINHLMKPYLHKRKVVTIAQKVLDSWEKGDLSKAHIHFDNPDISPPIYDLISSAILEKSYYEKDGLDYAEIKVKLAFPPGNMFSHSSEWVFIFIDTKTGWIITDFRPSNK